MNLDQIKREAHKSQNPIIVKVNGENEFLWFPAYCFDSQPLIGDILDATPIYWWSNKDEDWKEFKNKNAQEAISEIL